MSDLINKVKDNVNKAVVTVSVKSSNALEKGKINANISTLENEIQKIKTQLAERYYRMWVDENVNFDEIDEICQQILDKEVLISQQRERIAQIDAEEQNMQSKETAVKDTPSGMFCSQCGGKNTVDAKFCTHCGKPMVG